MNLVTNPYVLGIDLGAQSLGWTVIDQNPPPNSINPIRDIGVRIFDPGVDKLGTGKEESRCAPRRTARLMRRRMDRLARRMQVTFGLLQQAGLLPMAEGKNRPQILDDLDCATFAKYAKKLQDSGASKAEVDQLAQTLPYQLRKIALDEQLLPFELGRALYHLAQRRGFLSNRK